MAKIIPLFVIFLLGELVVNMTVFNRLKNSSKFKDKDSNKGNQTDKQIFGISLSVFKGSLERFAVYIGLVLGIPQILIVFGALKIGTRFDKSNEISNDYFLVGNFVSILTAMGYYQLFLALST